MKLCFISNLFPLPDQPQRGLFNLQVVEALAKKADVKVIVPMPGRGGQETGDRGQETGYGVLYLPVRHIPLLGRNLAARFHEKAFNTVREDIEQTDVIIGSWLYPDGVAAARLGSEMGKPVWIEVLGSDIYHLQSRSRRSMIQDACSKAAGVICVAEHLKQALIDAGVSENKIHVVPNGVDTKLFYPPEGKLSVKSYELLENAARANIYQAGGMNHEPTSNNRHEVLWIGNMVPVKGPDLMLKVWAALLRQVNSYQLSVIRQEKPYPATQHPGNSATNLHLTMIGDGPLRKKLERRARTMGLQNISFVGTLRHEEIADKMREASMLCLTSRSEGMPNVILEALASGLPVVASDVGGVSDMLASCSACRVISHSSGFAVRFAAAVKEVQGTEIDRRSLAEKQCLRTWDDVAEDMLRLVK